MKKSLVLAMAMALGVTASAYAANPFSDVPAGHWAYDSVAKLAAAGVVDGYADGAFDGDKLMTRYEMAQIVAKAMAKGADCDKLAAEFADELDTLGVRVAKLEKGADAVKITGQARFRYQSHDPGLDSADLRTRLFLKGAINEDWTYTGMFQSIQNISGSVKGDDEVQLKRAYVEGKLGGFDVTAGRWDEVVGIGATLDSYVDGVKLAYGKDVKVSVMAAKGGDLGDMSNTSILNDSADRIYVANVEAPVGPVDAHFTWFKADGVTTTGPATDKEIYNVGLTYGLAKDLNLAYDYMWADDDYNKEVSKDGYVVTLAYKGATDEVGSYGFHASYYDQPANAIIAPTYDLTSFLDQGGYEGWSIGVDYTVAKNVQLCVNYYDTEAKIAGADGKKADDQAIFSELYFFF